MREALEDYEHSDDEDVDLEGLLLGNGQYEKIAQFSKRVRKYQRFIRALQVIEPIQQAHRQVKKSEDPQT